MTAGYAAAQSGHSGARPHGARAFAPTVLDYGARGDGVSDDTPAFRECLAANIVAHVPPSENGYRITSTIEIPAGGAVIGASRRSTRLLHAFHGDMFLMREDAALADLSLLGDGASFGGGGLRFVGEAGRQNVRNCAIADFAEACLHFESGAGSQSSFINLLAWRTNAATGSDRYAVIISPDRKLTAVPRSFHNFQSGGRCSFDFGGANGVYIDNSFLADLRFSRETRGVLISNCRLANQQNLLVDGHNNTIVSCDINPVVTIAPGADNIVIESNSYNRPPVIDRSGNGRNLIGYFSVPYEPTIGRQPQAVTLGNGRILAHASRSGSIVSVSIEFLAGETTRFGDMLLEFGLPSFAPNTTRSDQLCGHAWVTKKGAGAAGAVLIPAGAQSAIVVAQGVGPARGVQMMKPGDKLNLSFSYRV